jgi:hypothetical protein
MFFTHICTSDGGPDIILDGLLWVRIFATRKMVMVKHKLELCDRYVVKERGQHRDRCQSIDCAYCLLAKDELSWGAAGWATSRNTWIIRARSFMTTASSIC